MMNKALLVLSFLVSYSAFANSTESTALKTESFAAQSTSIAHKREQNIQQLDANGSSVKRLAPQAKNKRQNTDSLKSTKLRYRADKPTASSQPDAYGFSVYDAWSYLDTDLDSDGFYHEFTVEFDVDYSGGYADIYAEMYLSLNGGPWVHFNTTDVFTINGTNGSDFYSVSTLLNSNFPTGYYDVAIDIYQAGYTGTVATVGPLDFNGLASLPLEDIEHEYGAGDTRITYVASTIGDDFDHDGFYTTLSLEYDIDTYDAGRMVYARVDITNADTFERTTLETDDFQIGNQTELLDILLDSGQHAGWYNVKISLIDSYTGQELTTAAQEYSALYELPLESVSNDDYFDDPYAQSGGNGSGSVVVVHESGGGSMGWLTVLGLILVIAAQRKQKAIV